MFCLPGKLNDLTRLGFKCGATNRHLLYHLEIVSSNPDDTTAICGQEVKRTKLDGNSRVVTSYTSLIMGVYELMHMEGG